MTPEEQIRTRIRTVFEQAGPEISGEMRDLVAINAPPSSSPGEPPHKRTGVLQAGITAAIDDPGPTLTIASTAPYSAALDGGTGRMAARPFFAVTIEKWTPLLIQRLQDAFR